MGSFFVLLPCFPNDLLLTWKEDFSNFTYRLIPASKQELDLLHLTNQLIIIRIFEE